MFVAILLHHIIFTGALRVLIVRLILQLPPQSQLPRCGVLLNLALAECHLSPKLISCIAYFCHLRCWTLQKIHLDLDYLTAFHLSLNRAEDPERIAKISEDEACGGTGPHYLML